MTTLLLALCLAGATLGPNEKPEDRIKICGEPETTETLGAPERW